jgi:hypothetical protein
MEADTLNLIGIVAIFLVVIVVCILVIQSQGATVASQLPTQLQRTFQQFVDTVLQKSPYNICEAYSGKEVSVQDFQTILQAVYQGQCGEMHANISLTFSLTQDDIVKLSKLSGIAGDGKFIFYNLTKPIGVGALLIHGTPGEYPLKTYDFIDMWQEGSPFPDTFIVKTIKGCDPTDEVCDGSCIFKRVCDSACDDNRFHNIKCNLACIDSNNNGVVDSEDAKKRIDEGKCSPDCYSSMTNPFKAYDPGCIWKFKDQCDGICDPNSNGVKDGICDPDCVPGACPDNVNNKIICDPDCDGIKSDGNPRGLDDQKCFVCDKKCNGWCSPTCTSFDKDPDCPLGFTGQRAECCGNGICNATTQENCETCAADCPGGGITCGDLNTVCCLDDPNTDYSGCTTNLGKGEGGTCFCNNQCTGDLACDETNHCCPAGKTWNGVACEFKYTFRFLFIQLNSQISNFKQKAESGKDTWVQLTPLKQCPDKVEAIIVDDKVCTGVPDQQPLCDCVANGFNCDAASQLVDQTMKMIEDCAKQWGYDGKYTRVEGVLPGTFVCSIGSTGGILGYTNLYDSRLLSAEETIKSTSSHEMGHTYGLCDEPYGIEPSDSCQSGWKAQGEDYCCPNAPDGPCIMCSYTNPDTGCHEGNSFAQDDYNHLQKELINKNKYCG